MLLTIQLVHALTFWNKILLFVQDGLSVDELANISISSKAESDHGDDDDQEGDTDDEDDVTSEQQSQSEAGNGEEEEDDDEEEGDDDDDDDSVPEARGDDKESKQSDGSTLNNVSLS